MKFVQISQLTTSQRPQRRMFLIRVLHPLDILHTYLGYWQAWRTMRLVNRLPLSAINGMAASPYNVHD